MNHAKQIDEFISRWAASSGAERSNYQLFLSELATLIGVELPQPAQSITSENAYVFDKSVPLPHGPTGFIDLYKRGCFVLEAKQGSNQVTKPEGVSGKTLQELARRKKGTAVRGALAAAAAPLTSEEVASLFKGRQTKKKVGQVREILETLVMLGQVASGDGGRFVGV